MPPVSRATAARTSAGVSSTEFDCLRCVCIYAFLPSCRFRWSNGRGEGGTASDLCQRFWA